MTQQLQLANEDNAKLTQQMAITAMSKPSSPPRSSFKASRGADGKPQMYTDEDYMALQREMRDKMLVVTRERTRADKIQVQFDALAANEQRLINEIEIKTKEVKEERQKALDANREAALTSMLQGQLNEMKKSYSAELELREDVEAVNRRLTQRIFAINSEGKGQLTRVQQEIEQEKK